jgi:hypothetical protein
VAASIPGRATARPQQSGQAVAPSHSGSLAVVTAGGNSMPAGCCLTDVPELMRVRLLPLARLLPSNKDANRKLACTSVSNCGLDDQSSCHASSTSSTLKAVKLGIALGIPCVITSWQTGSHAGDCPRSACGVWRRALVDSRGSGRQAASASTAVAQSVSPGAAPVPHLRGLRPTGQPNVYLVSCYHGSILGFWD